LFAADPEGKGFYKQAITNPKQYRAALSRIARKTKIQKFIRIGKFGSHQTKKPKEILGFH